jgi:hypothetical protein
MEIHELIAANIDVFVEPCELFVNETSGDKILSCFCRPNHDLEDIVQAIVDICCFDFWNDKLCKKFSIEILYLHPDNIGDVFTITKGANNINIEIDNGVHVVKRTIHM